jgi:hypothetical protein
MKTIKLLRNDYTRFMTNREGARHELKKSAFDLHGPVRLASPGGRFVAIVRTDPGDAPEKSEETEEHVSTDTMAAQLQSMKRMKNSGLVGHAPSPKGCKCAAWPWEERELDEKRKPKSHHPKCALGKMWERQKGGKITSAPGGPLLEARIHRSGKPSELSREKPHLMGKPSRPTMKLKGDKVQKIPHPESCPKCVNFTKSKRMEQDQHHPTCEYYKKYKALSLARASAGMPAPKPDDQRIMLFDLEQQAVVRVAESDEVEEARNRLRDEGIALCEVDERQYLVCYEDGTTIEPSEGEPLVSNLEGESDPVLGSDTERPPALAEDEPVGDQA